MHKEKKCADTFRNDNVNKLTLGTICHTALHFAPCSKRRSSSLNDVILGNVF